MSKSRPGEFRSRQVGTGKGSGEPALPTSGRVSLPKGCAPQMPKTLWAGGWEQGIGLFEMVS